MSLKKWESGGIIPRTDGPVTIYSDQYYVNPRAAKTYGPELMEAINRPMILINRGDMLRAEMQTRHSLKRLVASYGALSKEVEKTNIACKKLGRTLYRHAPRMSKSMRKHIRREKAKARR